MSRWNKSLFRTLVLLSLPTMVEEILRTLLQYVDTAMVGQLGEQATAAVSVTTTITWLVNSISASAATAVLALISQAVGAGDRERAGKLAQQALILSVGCGAVCGGASIALSPFIPVWMGAEPAIRATQNTKTPMLISLGANLLNAGLNYLLIYICALGVEGAAIASAASYTLSGALMFLAYRRTPLLRWRWREFSADRGLLRHCAQVGVPVLGTSVTSCLGYVVFAGMVSDTMGTTVFAAHSIAVTAETIFYIPGYGLRTATSALVGAALGEGNDSRLRAVGRLSVGLTVAMMCLSGVVLYLAARPLMALFSPSAAVVELGAEMLRLVAFSEPFFGLMIVLEGILYGMGRTRGAFLIETGSMWGVRILSTYLCVGVWGLGLRAVWYCMIADNVCKALLFAGIFFLGRDGWRRQKR